MVLRRLPRHAFPSTLIPDRAGAHGTARVSDLRANERRPAVAGTSTTPQQSPAKSVRSTLSSVITYLGDSDLTLFHYVTGASGQSLALDHIANRLGDSQLKGLAFSATFGAPWFQRWAKHQFRRRQTLILLLVAIILSLVVARVFADLLPFRLRPMFAADIGYRAPLFHTDSYFEDWSSFPE